MNKQTKIKLALSAMGMIAVFLPWFNIMGRSINGTFEGFDGFGYFCLISFLITGLMVYFDEKITFNYKKYVTALIAFLPVLLILIKTDGLDMPGSFFDFVGFGLILVFLSSLLLPIFLLRNTN